jgi:hypothetical protein
MDKMYMFGVGKFLTDAKADAKADAGDCWRKIVDRR